MIMSVLLPVPPAATLLVVLLLSSAVVVQVAEAALVVTSPTSVKGQRLQPGRRTFRNDEGRRRSSSSSSSVGGGGGTAAWTSPLFVLNAATLPQNELQLGGTTGTNASATAAAAPLNDDGTGGSGSSSSSDASFSSSSSTLTEDQVWEDWEHSFAAAKIWEAHVRAKKKRRMAAKARMGAAKKAEEEAAAAAATRTTAGGAGAERAAAAATGGAGGAVASVAVGGAVAKSPSVEARREAGSKAKAKANGTTDADDADFGPPNVDAMRARAGVLRTSIVRRQMELQELERQILCCSRPAYPIATTLSDLLSENRQSSSDGNDNNNLLQATVQSVGRSLETLASSTNVLMRKLGRVRTKTGPKNQQWNSVGEFVTHQSKTAGRIVKNLVDNPDRLRHLVDPETPTLVPHVPAILARLDRLEQHVEPILERVLNNRRHLASVEPYLDEILERFDDIEPHLPWILDNVDTLAPYTGLLLKHIDELLLYADADAHEMSSGTQYDLAEQLLPYLEYYVSKLDIVGPHLPLLRPHVPLLLKHNRIAKVSPHIDRLFARGYTDLSASANMDVLLFWFGWSLRIPGLPALFFSLPWSPRIVSFLANRMPKRFCRGYCSGISCSVDGNYGSRWNKLEKA